VFIAIPSFALLYSMDEVVVDPAMTIKAIGHQWYRTYEYSDYNSSDEQSLTFDSYTIPEDDLELGQSRLLEVDNRVVVPAKTHLRIIVTSADVPHSWAVPSLSVTTSHSSGGSSSALFTYTSDMEEDSGSYGRTRSTSVNQPQQPRLGEQNMHPGPPSHTGAVDSAPTSADQNFDPQELYKKKVELQTLVREQLRHFCERGWPRDLQYYEERDSLYEKAAQNIISSLEIGETLSEHDDWISHLKTHPKTLDGLYRDYHLIK
jgi:hypothetical protein